ncbi:MAG: phosphatidylserine/phosphatidylglycerophosphate/cardiolipin synthase family protein, partial [Myxococcales bacterium]|nr:phosphatidylserine/phosphatidylglycerophosphate/cardiolipin synthase family protein [Myxococcales bacterium]
MGESIAKSSAAALFIDLTSAEGRRALLSHLGGARLSLSVDLAAGTHDLAGDPGEGRRGPTLTVRRDTRLALSLSLARDADGNLTLGLSSLSLTRPVKVERGLHPFVPLVGGLLDALFDIHFQGFRHQVGRPLELEAGLRCGIVELKPPAWLLARVKSVIDEQVRARLAPSPHAIVVASGPTPALAQSRASLVRLGARLIRHADWEVAIDLQPLAAGGKLPLGDVHWSLSERQISFAGTVASQSNASLRVELEHGGGDRLSAGGHVLVSAQGDAVSLEGDARLRVPLAGGVLTVRPAPEVAVPLELRGARCAVHVRSSWALRDERFSVGRADVHLALDARLADGHPVSIGPGTLRTQGGQISVTASADLSAEGGVLRATGAKLDAIVAARQVDLFYRRFNARLDGLAALEVDLRDIAFDTTSGLARATGVTRTTLGEPAKEGADMSFPHVMPAADMTLGPKASLTMTPRPPSAGDLLSELFELSPNIARVVDPRKMHGFASGSPELKRLVTDRTEAELRRGNRVRPLIDGAASFPERLRLIREAKRTLCVQTLIFKEDTTGKQIIDALIDARARNLEVRVIIDAVGNVESVKDATQGKPFYRRLRDAGVELRLYNDPLSSWLSELVPVLRDIPEIEELPLADLPKILKDPAMLLRLLNRLQRMSTGRNRDALDHQGDIKRVMQSIDAAGQGQMAHAPKPRRLGELGTLMADNVVSASELIALIKRSQVLNHRWHEKYLIADGRAVVMGGMNIADEYMLGGTDTLVETLGEQRAAWRDMDVLIEGPAAADAFASFADNWAELDRLERVRRGAGEPEPRIVTEPAPPFEGGVEVQVIQHRPLEDGDHSIGNFMIEQLKALGRGDRALIANAYFLPTGALTAYKLALMDAAERGVDVRVVTNAGATSDLPNIN